MVSVINLINILIFNLKVWIETDSDIVLVRPLNLLITSDVFIVSFMIFPSPLTDTASVDMFIMSATNLIIDFNLINDSFTEVYSFLNLVIVISLTNSSPFWNTLFWNIPANIPNAPTFIVSTMTFILPTILFVIMDILTDSLITLVNPLNLALKV